jgi:hypothetical protein
MVAVPSVKVMQVTADEMVRVVAVWHGLVSAGRAVLVSRLVRGAAVTRGAAIGVRAIDRDGALHGL